ncbi:hypothetical protein [Nocardioides zhouii]|uniref:PQQ-binding-like beta-propeller repeat protein n=1 Tax=Nocardioides zhouii TaxID=1168729 RepID=A0A4Q2SNW6_9ACTN|nr:hypothetical protein [Nocardioides zhouii]RYC07322.1 hypothetical protein EUA94_14635 [Nocardioides zhouii]
MVWLVGALLLLWLAWGPVVLVVAAAVLCVPRARWWVQDRIHVDRRAVAILTGAVAALVALVLAVPDGWLPIPPAPGTWAAPSYVGRPVTPHPVVAAEVPQNPHRVGPAPVSWPGPLGLQPEVETSWLGLQRCGDLAPTSTGVLVARCTDRSGASLRMVDAETMRPTATYDLGETSDDPACATEAFYVDDADRAVVAGVRAVSTYRTRSGGDESALDPDGSWDLRPWIPFGDCVVAIAPDWSGLVWWVSRQGLVGTLAPESGRVAVTDLGEQVRRGLAVDEGGAYVVTDEALHRLVAGAEGAPQEQWRTEYAGASGSAPVLLDGGVVAVTDTVESRLGVVFLARDTGAGLCRQSVFEEDDGATSSTLAPLGRGVVVANNHGYSSPRSTLLGFTSDAGIARVDLGDDGCVVEWTSEAVSPSSGVTASWPTGLVYAWTKRPSMTGVSAWYLTALDAESGRTMWSVRTGTGLLAGSDGSRITIGPDGSAWVGTLAGLVRVRDRS